MSGFLQLVWLLRAPSLEGWFEIEGFLCPRRQHVFDKYGVDAKYKFRNESNELFQDQEGFDWFEEGTEQWTFLESGHST